MQAELEAVVSEITQVIAFSGGIFDWENTLKKLAELDQQASNPHYGIISKRHKRFLRSGKLFLLPLSASMILIRRFRIIWG